MAVRLDPDQRRELYGEPGETRLYVRLVTPWGIAVVVHRYIARVFLEACLEAAARSLWQPRRIDSYNNRPTRGGTDPSTHAHALAGDFFSTPPGVTPPGGVWTPDDPPDAAFVDAFERWGFTWGGRWRRLDLPHFEWATAPPAVDFEPEPWAPPAPAPSPQEEPDVFTVLFPGRDPETGRNAYVKVDREGHVNAYNGAPDFPSLEEVSGFRPPVIGAARADDTGNLVLFCDVAGDDPFTGYSYELAPR